MSKNKSSIKTALMVIGGTASLLGIAYFAKKKIEEKIIIETLKLEGEQENQEVEEVEYDEEEIEEVETETKEEEKMITIK